jgi:N-acetylglucosamine kinase-like BadF-type ATPase
VSALGGERAALLLAVEGGGSRTQAVILDATGACLGLGLSGDINTNFVAGERAAASVAEAVDRALAAADVSGKPIQHVALGLVGAPLLDGLLSRVASDAEVSSYNERDVVFARAGRYTVHGVGAVAATGASAWARRDDDGRETATGGWGALLGDEGSAYAAGLLGLRAVARAVDGRAEATTLTDAAASHFGLPRLALKHGLVELAYGKPLGRADIAQFARCVTAVAAAGDPTATRIVAKVAADFAALPLHVARLLFDSAEAFPVVIAGGLLAAGEMMRAPLAARLAAEFPLARLEIGAEEPAIALGRLALHRWTCGQD